MLYQIFILFKVEIPFRNCKFPFQYISFAGAHDCPLDNPNPDLKKEKFQEQIRNQILGILWWDLKISSSSTTYNHHKTWHRKLGVVLVRSIFILAWFPQSSFVQQWRSSGWHLTQLWWQPSLYKRITFSLQKQGIHKSFHLRMQNKIQARWVLLRGPQNLRPWQVFKIWWS